MFLVQDVEIRDRLAQSQINKFLYQYTSEACPKQTHANMVRNPIINSCQSVFLLVIESDQSVHKTTPSCCKIYIVNSVILVVIFVVRRYCRHRQYHCFGRLTVVRIGLLQLTITWYKIRHAGGQAHYYSRTGTSKQRQVKLQWCRSLCFNVPVRK